MPVITDQTIYTTDYCTSFTGDSCVERTKIISLEKQDVKDIVVESISVASVMIISLFILLFLFKWIIYLIMPNRGKKTF